METLERRIVPVVNVNFVTATNTLTLTGNAVTADVVTVNAGSTYTDILVSGKFQTRLTEATSDNISIINFTGDTGSDRLTVNGVNGPGGSVTIGLTGVEQLLLNTKTTTVTGDGALALGKSTVAGALNVTLSAAGALTQFGKVSVSGTTTVSTTNSNITLSSSGNTFGTLILNAGTGDINIKEAGPTNLGAITANDLVVKSTGAITDNGTINLSDNGPDLATSSFTSSSSITLDEPASDFPSTMTLKGTNIQIDNNAATVLGSVTASGNFTLTSNGNVTHPTGNLKITGTATVSVDTPATQDIDFSDGTNNFGSLVLSANDIQVSEKSALDIGTTTATGALTLIAKGAVTDSGQVTVTGDTSITATKDITLDESTSSYGNGVGVVELNGVNISMINNGATDFGTVNNATFAVIAKGTLTLESAGDVTQTDELSVVGRATVTVADPTADSITLDNVGNVFGSISVTGFTVVLAESGAMNLYTSEVYDDLTIDTTGAVTDSGDILVIGNVDIDATAAFSITLDSTGNAFGDAGGGGVGTLTLNGLNITINNTEVTELLDVDAAGNLTITSDSLVFDNGAGDVDVAGRLTVTTPDDIILDNAGNTFASIAVNGGGGGTGEVNLTDADGLDIVSATSVGNLVITTTGAITDSGAVSVTGTTTLAAGAANDITLNTATNSFGGNVTITTGDDVTLVDSDGLGLGISGTAISGNLNLTANGDVTNNGVALSVGTADTSITVAAAGDISLTNLTLPDAAGVEITLTLSGVNATITPAAAPATERDAILSTTNLSGTFSLSNVNDVTDSGKLTIAGTVMIDSTNDAADVITLNSVGNTFGTLNLDAFDITVVEAAATNLGTVGADGALSITSSGDVTDTGTVTVVGTTTVNANGGNDITLDSAANSFGGSLTLNANDITIRDAGTSVLALVSATGAFSLTTTGAVSQTGNVSVGGLATISTSSTIDLDGAAQTINFGSLSLTGTDVDINEDSATNLASVSASTLDVISAGAVTDSGTLTVSGAVSVTAGTGTLDAITLNDPSSTFGDLTLDGGSITIVENAPTQFDDVDAAGSLSVTSAGAITQDTGELTVAGLATLVAYNGASNQDITLNTATNDFESISVTGAAVTLRDADGIDLSTSTISSTLTLNALGSGDVTDSGVVSVSGLATINAGGVIELDEAGSTYANIDVSADSVLLITYSGLTITDADATLAAVGDIVIIASGAITDGGASSLNATRDIFVQAGLDPADPTRELDPTDSSDAALLNALNISGANPVFGGTETYIGSIVNVT